MTDKDIEDFKKKLETLEKELEEEISLAKNNSQPVKLDQQAVGRVSRIDAIQQQQMHLSGLKRLEQRLALVKAAQSRIASGDFGHCISCEEPIELKRLKARPESAVCVDCAQGRG